MTTLVERRLVSSLLLARLGSGLAPSICPRASTRLFNTPPWLQAGRAARR